MAGELPVPVSAIMLWPSRMTLMPPDEVTKASAPPTTHARCCSCADDERVLLPDTTEGVSLRVDTRHIFRSPSPTRSSAVK